MPNNDIFLGSGASLTFVPENDIYLGVCTQTGGTAFDGLTEVTALDVSSDFSTNFSLVNDLYVGCILERYNSSHALQSSHRITKNLDGDEIQFTPSVTPAASDYFIITSYGAPVPAPTASTYKRLLADEWLGIVESATFPTTEIDMKQMNLSLGGSRNYTYQYKGVTNFGNGDLGLVANHGAWLYYFLGKCTTLICSTEAVTTTIASNFNHASASDNDKVLIEGLAGGAGVAVGTGVTINDFAETGPIFHRLVGSDFCPPILPNIVADLADLDVLTRPSGTTTLSDPITYTFEEQDGDLLPSFAIEQVLSKLESSNTYRASESGAEDLNFVKIARGCRLNTLTMTANENEELKMSLSLNVRNVHELDQTEKYEARRAVTDETAFFNFETSTNSGETREPFFFSDGTFTVLGQTFLKINTLTLTMNNNLQDRRFLGVGNKNVQESIPAQRTYELSFTGHVTDDALYTALLNDTENTTQTIELVFTKANGENITLNFTDYFVSANNFPIADDKGPIVVEATVLPRNLSLCTVKTHWVLQG